MNINLENVSNHFKQHLLNDVVLRTDKKIIRHGILKFFSIKQYFIQLVFDTEKGTKVYQIPYPFKIESNDDRTTLNYHITSFTQDPDILLKTKLVDTSNKSKFYDNLVYLLPKKNHRL